MWIHDVKKTNKTTYNDSNNILIGHLIYYGNLYVYHVNY